jgi:hypothetical protein
MFKASYRFRSGRLRLEVTDGGFSLWDEIEDRWVLDASMLDQEPIVTLSNDIEFIRGCQWEKPRFELFRRRPTPKKNKKITEPSRGE